MGNIIDISTIREKHKFDIDVKDVKFLEILHYALSHFYALQTTAEGKQPKEYNPILYYDIMACFDPFLMNQSQALEILPDGSGTWKPWPIYRGIKRTKIFIKDVLIPRREKLRSQIDINTTTSNPMRKQDVLAQYFTYTKEDLSENETVLSIIYNSNNKLKRVHIKDLEKVCSYLAFNKSSFPRLPKPITISHHATTEIWQYLEDGSNIDIKDENVYEILKNMGVLDSKIYYIS